MSILSPGDFKRFIVGQITANGTTVVTLNVAGLEANSFVHTNINTPSGTVAALATVTKTPATNGAPGVLGFSSAAGNTSLYDIFVLV